MTAPVVHAASIPPCPANKARGGLWLIVAAASEFRVTGVVPAWARVEGER